MSKRTYADLKARHAQKKRNSKRNFWKHIKQVSFANNPVCGICEEQIVHIRLASLDHIKPRSLGGRSTIGNLQLAHRKCNKEKDDKEVSSSIPIKVDISLPILNNKEDIQFRWRIKNKKPE